MRLYQSRGRRSVGKAVLMELNLFFSLLQPATQSRTEELETYAQLLVFKFNHLRGRIKQIADQHLTKLIDK